MSKTAVIILNRNLPDITDKLYESIDLHNRNCADIFVLEAGSDKSNLSKYCSWWANSDEIMNQGLRVPRGLNYALTELWKAERFTNYDTFLFLTNDAEFGNEPVVELLQKEMQKHPRVGILSPCSKRWGEYNLLGQNSTKYFWYVHNVAHIMRREYIESVMEIENPSHMNFLYDGSNFRGYGLETELVAKGYANDWSTAITTAVIVEENESYLKNKADLIKTDTFEDNIKKYVEEGKRWMRRKYGFNSRWSLQMYSKFFYDKFFEYYPELKKFKL